MVFFMLSAPFLRAQKTDAYLDKDALYKTGLELFDKKQYAEAQKSFNEFATTTKSHTMKSDALYYAAACGIELFNKDAEWLMRQFILKHPESNKLNSAYFYLGKSDFRKKKYKETIEHLEKVEPRGLNKKEEQPEFYFKRAYSYLQQNNAGKAKTDFAEIKDIDNKYAFPANYYYSHIAYQEKNYETALSGFNRLVGDATFGSVVPYYITQIYFIQGKYKEVTEEAPKLLNDSANVQKEVEINRMIGESYFNLKDYKSAMPYLRKAGMGGMNAEGNYVLGYCYYKLGDCKSAVVCFEKATVLDDTLGQNSWYRLGDCYIKNNEKLKAKNAFYSAYKMKHNPKISEDALFSFAKLSYELDFSPYNEAAKSFQTYLKEYPNSPRKDECYNFLINVYSYTKNYAQAIASIEAMETIDPMLKVTYQKLMYFRGVDYFNNNKLADAEKQFKKALAQNADMKWNCLSQYWLGEIYFLRKDYTTAIDAWKKFQVMQGATQLQEYDLSNYNMAYAYFERKEKDDYTNANISFRKFLLTQNEYDEKKIADANIRAADCYFMNRDFAQASGYYKKAIELKKLDVDYCLYQKALGDGLIKRYDDKVNELKKIETNYPHSNYLSAALNEIADTYYKNLKDEENAILYYERILKNYPNSSFTNNCYAQLGYIYFGRKQDDKAFEYFDKFVKNDTKSDAAKDVMESIKKIFETKNDVEGMEQYFVSVGNPLSENQLEKANYLAAYDAFYTQKNCDLALPKWESYISKFPNGKYMTEAQFNLAECAYSKNDFEKALSAYQYVIKQTRSVYSETSLTKASYLLYKDKKYEEALPLFQTLQEMAETPANKSAGKFGAMRSAFYLNNFEVALEEANKVLNTEKITPQQTSEAHYIKAKSLYETKRLDDALTAFTAITKSAKNLTGAEAYYFIGKIQFSKQDYKSVEKTVSKLIGYEYSNDEWNNKGMLLLADAYLANNDDANAEVILQTIIDNKPKQEFIDEAQKRLDELQKKRNATSNAQQSHDMKIQFNQTKQDSLLFDNLLNEEPEQQHTGEEPK